MRMLLKVQMDTQASNEAIRQGNLQKIVAGALESLRPEAAYFTVEDGCRTGYIFFDLEDPSRMPSISEPFFLQLGARVHYSPVMNQEDLRKGLAAMMSGS
ncbi:hypothetical protein [Streptomyces gardneri]|uniref:Uncharacterized protein n=1 Tax=Streptomyces gardneri TaxID=66892 RepID=A0A4Y3RJB5_9ACTN|nr:hypothetical protein [Streptomyces gardneri]GEB55930.1 hypothetical protein SGA01_15350 [Streptomyces gardneri]GHH08933.1 hypothetical protein GCM10017674_51980 [Streptomyces gardneri]